MGPSNNTMRMSFAHKREHSFEQRVAESARVRERYNDRVPVICEKTPSSDMPCQDKCPMPAPRTCRTRTPPSRTSTDALPPLRIAPRQVEVPHPDGHDGLRRAVVLSRSPITGPAPGSNRGPRF